MFSACNLLKLHGEYTALQIIRLGQYTTFSDNSLNNDVRFMGFCAEKPVLTQSQQGSPMAILVVYTQELIKSKEPINQAHRCVFFGNKVEMIVKFASTGRHIHLRGSLRSKVKGRISDTIPAFWLKNSRRRLVKV